MQVMRACTAWSCPCPAPASPHTALPQVLTNCEGIYHNLQSRGIPCDSVLSGGWYFYYLTEQFVQEMSRMVNAGSAHLSQFHFFLGNCGWGPQQLEGELEMGICFLNPCLTKPQCPLLPSLKAMVVPRCLRDARRRICRSLVRTRQPPEQNKTQACQSPVVSTGVRNAEAPIARTEQPHVLHTARRITVVLQRLCTKEGSRLGSMCRAYPQMKTLDHTLDLFLSMPPPKRGAKKTRGQICSGLVAIMLARLRRFLLAITTNRMVHVEWNIEKKAVFPVPDDIKFPTRPPDHGGEALYHKLLTRSPSTLTRVAHTPTDEVMQLLSTIARGRDPRDHAGRDAQVPRVRDAAIGVEDDDDEALDAVVVSESRSQRSVADLIVDVDAHDDGPARFVLLQ